MPCEKYREALTEAAAEGAAPALTRELRVHVDACTSCRAFFNDEQRLFSAIDFGVARHVNTEVPAHLLQRYRALVADDPLARRPFTLWTMFATVGIAAVMVIVFVLRVHRPSTHNPPAPEVVASHRTPTTTTSANTTSNEAGRKAVKDATHATLASNPRDRANSRLHTPVSQQPSLTALEVIVPPEEREALARYIAAEKRSQLPAMISLSASSELSPRPLVSLEIPDLEMKSLPDLGGDTPDSTKEN